MLQMDPTLGSTEATASIAEVILVTIDTTSLDALLSQICRTLHYSCVKTYLDFKYLTARPPMTAKKAIKQSALHAGLFRELPSTESTLSTK